MSSRLPSRPGSVPEYACCDERETRQAGAPQPDPAAGGADGGTRNGSAACVSLSLRARLRRAGQASWVHLYMAHAERTAASRPRELSPERRCSSRTFRYGYLVTT